MKTSGSRLLLIFINTEWLSVAANEFEVLSNEALELANDMIEINATITVVTDDFFLNIYNSEYQTIAEYKVTLTGKISNAGNEIISVSFEHVSGDECEPDYEIDGNTVSVSITHPTEGRFLEVDRIEDFDTVVVALKQLADLADHAAFRVTFVKIEKGNVTNNFHFRNHLFSLHHASDASSCPPECPCSSG